MDISSAKKRIQTRFQTQLKDNDSSYEFVNILTESFYPGLADVINISAVSPSPSLDYSTLTNSIWDKPDNNSNDLNTNTLLLDNIFNAFSNSGDECQSL